MEKSYNSRGDGLLLRSAAATHSQGENKSAAATTSFHDFVLQWGNRKRLRCMKFQNSDRNNKHDLSGSDSAAVHQRTDRVDRRVVRSGHNKDSNSISNAVVTNNTNGGNGYFNLRQRPASPSHRILRYSDTMRGQSNGVKGLASPDRAGPRNNHHDNTSNNTRCNNSNNNNNDNNNNNNNNSNNGNRGGRSPSSETTNDGKKGGSPSASDAIPAVWHPKFAIALTNKEKEEDFLVLKGSKLPQRPKKRAKFVQRTVNLISPGAWLCDLSLERYEVREKKVSKKRPRGLKAMGNMDSDSE